MRPVILETFFLWCVKLVALDVTLDGRDFEDEPMKAKLRMLRAIIHAARGVRIAPPLFRSGGTR
jgi:hypothetical protein